MIESLAKDKYDFTERREDSKYRTGFLDKKGKTGTTWKRRYFYLNNGILRYYEKGPLKDTILEGEVLKGQILLRGATLTIYKLSRIDIVCPSEKINTVSIRATSAADANEWFDALTVEIERVNIVALKSNSSLPEVVTWYYNLQSEVANRNKNLENEVSVEYTYSDPFRKGAEKKTNIRFSVRNQKHLLIQVEDKGKPFDSVESSVHNKLIPLIEILGAMTETSYSEGSNSTFFKMKLISVAETYSCQFLQPGGPTWLKHLQDLVSFVHIPPPATANTSTKKVSQSPHSSGLNLNSLNSNNNQETNTKDREHASSNASSYSPSSSFLCSRDIIEYLSKLQTQTSIPYASDCASILIEIFNKIPEVKSNKKVAGRFANKLEKVVRILKEILSSSLVSDITLVQFHMSSLKSRLQAALNYLKIQSSPGWLQSSSTIEGNAIFQYKDLYNNIINIINNMTRTIMKIEPTLNPIYESHAVDVKSALDSTGSYDKIANDPALVEALADKLDSLPMDVQTELNLMLIINGKKPVSSSSQRDSRQTNTASTTCCLCCCFRRKRRNDKNTNTMNSSNHSDRNKPVSPDVEIKQKLVTFAGPPGNNTVNKK